MAGKPKSIDAGTRFGKLTVVGVGNGIVRVVRGVTHSKVSTSFCQCDCGKTADVANSWLKNGQTSSCGCLRRDLRGLSRSPEGRCWVQMMRRCHDPGNEHYNAYGARGISVCQEWRDSIEAFIAHIGPRPSSIHTVDRIDVHGNYEPGNVRWATPRQQQNNKRKNRLIEFEKEVRTIAQWAYLRGWAEATITSRLDIYGWSISDTLTIEPAKRNRGFGTKTRREYDQEK